ncbi:frizzled-5-like [Ornithodoros turicata]
MRLVFVGALVLSLSSGMALGRERCEDITIPMCKGIGYNQTYMPNQFNQETQDEAGMEVHQFWPLVEIQCSDDLKFFLCSLYTPICMEEYPSSVPACRSVCERARAGCAPIMRQYGFAWPERMNCEALPEYGDQEHLCMDSKEGARPEGMHNNYVVVGSPAKGTPAKERGRNGGSPMRTRTFTASGRERTRDQPSSECSCHCNSPLVNTTDPHFYTRDASSVVPECALPCRMFYFTGSDERFATYWIGVWAVLCCVSTSLTVLTFLIDTTRFRYPERPIIFLSFCYLMVSVGYLVRLVLNHEPIACDGNIVRYNVSSRPAACTVVFILLYFFGMASSMWWVILTLTWLLAAGLKWGNEAIASYSQYFHIVAWMVPTIKTIVAILLSAVDGDSVAGVCYVGNQNIANLQGFVLGPLVVYLFLGTSFLLAGFVSLFRIRSVIRAQARVKADKLEKLMIRIGIFSVLYTVPATVVIACYFYENYYREAWVRRLQCPCTKNNETPKPHFFMFMVKYFMCLVVGITSGFWIWSGKTLESWWNFYARLCLGRRRGRDVVGEFPDPHVRTFKQSISPVSHIGQLSSHGGKQLPLSHV